MKMNYKFALILIFLCMLLIPNAHSQNKFEKIGVMETILGKIEIYAIWTEDLVNPQAAAGISFNSGKIIILVRPEYWGPFSDALNKALEKVKPVYNGPKLTEEEKTIAKVELKFEKNYEVIIQWMPRSDEGSKGVVYIRLLHEGNPKSDQSVSLMMYPEQAEAFIKATAKAVKVAETKAAESKEI